MYGYVYIDYGVHHCILRVDKESFNSWMNELTKEFDIYVRDEDESLPFARRCYYLRDYHDNEYLVGYYYL